MTRYQVCQSRNGAVPSVTFIGRASRFPPRRAARRRVGRARLARGMAVERGDGPERHAVDRTEAEDAAVPALVAGRAVRPAVLLRRDVGELLLRDQVRAAGRVAAGVRVEERDRPAPRLGVLPEVPLERQRDGAFVARWRAVGRAPLDRHARRGRAPFEVAEEPGAQQVRAIGGVPDEPGHRGRSASSRHRYAAASAPLARYGRCTFSFGEWMRSSGSPTPRKTTGASSTSARSASGPLPPSRV